MTAKAENLIVFPDALARPNRAFFGPQTAEVQTILKAIPASVYPERVGICIQYEDVLIAKLLTETLKPKLESYQQAEAVDGLVELETLRHLPLCYYDYQSGQYLPLTDNQAVQIEATSVLTESLLPSGKVTGLVTQGELAGLIIYFSQSQKGTDQRRLASANRWFHDSPLGEHPTQPYYLTQPGMHPDALSEFKSAYTSLRADYPRSKAATLNLLNQLGIAIDPSSFHWTTGI